MADVIDCSKLSMYETKPNKELIEDPKLFLHEIKNSIITYRDVASLQELGMLARWEI